MAYHPCRGFDLSLGTRALRIDRGGPRRKGLNRDRANCACAVGVPLRAALLDSEVDMSTPNAREKVLARVPTLLKSSSIYLGMLMALALYAAVAIPLDLFGP